MVGRKGTDLTLEISRVCKTKGKRTIHKHYTIVCKVFPPMGVWINISDTAIQVYWN